MEEFHAVRQTDDHFYLMTLGCAKNEVDAENMSYLMREAGYELTLDPAEASFLIVNTCGFIQSAKEEAIAAILDLADFKAARLETGRNSYLIVTGCLAQRYGSEIYAEFPEVDLVLGTAEYAEIAAACTELKSRSLRGRLPGKPGSIEHLRRGEQAAPDRPFAYLKIAEGCSNVCAYCAIPGIRGPLCSRPLEDITEEAVRLEARGFAEIILIAQDTTRYGMDRYGELCLTRLLERLLAATRRVNFRIMYVYGDVFSEELIQLMASEQRILPYLDLPIQHASARMLRAMNRRDTPEGLRTLIAELRQRIPGLVLRTTVMVGFPGETDEDFQQLKTFLEEVRFDRLGCFIFSPEEGTAAAQMPQNADEKIVRRRYNEIMELQQEISLEKNLGRIGRVYDVLIEGVAQDGVFFLGRSYAEAPSVDPAIYVIARRPDVVIGRSYPVEIVEADAYDLTGVTV